MTNTGIESIKDVNVIDYIEPQGPINPINQTVTNNNNSIGLVTGLETSTPFIE